MLEGELTDFRNGQDVALTRTKGDTSFEKGGVIYWWRNDNAENAVAIVVGIVPNEST
jgi:hypothetical protein